MPILIDARKTPRRGTTAARRRRQDVKVGKLRVNSRQGKIRSGLSPAGPPRTESEPHIAAHKIYELDVDEASSEKSRSSTHCLAHSLQPSSPAPTSSMRTATSVAFTSAKSAVKSSL